MAGRLDPGELEDVDLAKATKDDLEANIHWLYIKEPHGYCSSIKIKSSILKTSVSVCDLIQAPTFR